MQSEPQCMPCVIKQCERLVYALKPGYGSEDTEHILSQIRHHALENAAQLTLQDPPSKFTSQILAKVYELLKTDDPYEATKKEENEIGKKIYNSVHKEIQKNSDSVHLAIKYAASGNIIDVGPAQIYTAYDPKQTILDEINKLITQPLFVDDYRIFKEKFRSAERILYILDNSGEIYLDKLLIEKLKGPEITMVVKSTPILNDALMIDAIEAGLDSLGKIITVNKDKKSRFLGVDFDATSDEFNEAFENSDMVIAKGHANYESLIDCERDCFFLLMAKCPVVAQKLGVKIKDHVFKYSAPKETEG
jgi:damage-control phosphatase, subfamily I